MRKFLLRAILFGAIVALFTLALAPAMALAAPVNMDSHCGTADKPAVPVTNSCLMHCQIIQCRLSSADSRAVNIPAPGGTDSHVCLNTPAAEEPAPVCPKAAPPQPVDTSPPFFDVIYQCRNSLNSDDPASL